MAFSLMLREANHIIVNANSVKVDAENFMPSFKAKLHVLPFSPAPRIEWLNDRRDLRQKYEIEKPFFIISNQFWIHKDHSTAFHAFARFLSIVGRKYQLVCTGDRHDMRFPGYYDSILDTIERLNLKADIRILGHIPKLDQIALVKSAICLIQPTLFEGGPGRCFI